jgi:hypothetical protein
MCSSHGRCLLVIFGGFEGCAHTADSVDVIFAVYLLFQFNRRTSLRCDTTMAEKHPILSWL